MATLGEVYGPAMVITDQAEADRWFDARIQKAMAVGITRKEAEEVERSNLGYYAGYWDNETRDRVYRLFNAPHPIFGTSDPTWEEAFVAGLKRGRELREAQEKTPGEPG